MGKTKIKTIDDSMPQEKVKKAAPKKKEKDELVAKLREELGIEEESQKERAKDDAASQLSEPGEEGQKAQALTSVTPSEPVSPKAKGELEKQIQTSEQSTKQEPKSKPRSKKYQEKAELVEKNKFYPLNEAVELVKQLSYSKFEGTLEAHINTTQAGIRGLVSLPFASGKKLKILAFGKGAEQSGADLAGDDSTMEEISAGKVNFDLIVTTPEWMSKLAKVAKVLGPKGLMPNPKNGTITDDLKKAVEGFQSGKTEYKTEPKASLIHQSLGKVTQPAEELQANVKTLVQTIGKTRVKKMTLSPTMGPSVKVDLGSI